VTVTRRSFELHGLVCELEPGVGKLKEFRSFLTCRSFGLVGAIPRTLENFRYVHDAAPTGVSKTFNFNSQR
jgi:hypothetical protein